MPSVTADRPAHAHKIATSKSAKKDFVKRLPSMPPPFVKAKKSQHDGMGRKLILPLVGTSKKQLRPSARVC